MLRIPSLYKEECAKEYFYGRKEETFIEKTGNTEKKKGENGSTSKQAKRSRHTRTYVTDKTTNCQHTKAKHLNNNHKYGN